MTEKFVSKFSEEDGTHTLVIASGSDFQWWKDVPPKDKPSTGAHFIKSGNSFNFHLDHYNESGVKLSSTDMGDGYKFISGLDLLVAASGSVMYHVPLTIEVKNVNKTETDKEVKFSTNFGAVIIDKSENTTRFEPKPLEEKVKVEDKAEAKVLTNQQKEQKTEENKVISVETGERKWNKDTMFLITTGIAFVELIGLLILGISNYNFSISNYNLQNEVSLVSEPIIVPIMNQVKGNSTNVNFTFFITNPSKNTDYFLDFSSSECRPNSKLIKKHQVESNATTHVNVSSVFENQNVVIIGEQPQSSFPLPSSTTTPFYCRGYDIENPENDTKTFMTLCIKVKRITDLICEDVPILIFKI